MPLRRALPWFVLLLCALSLPARAGDCQVRIEGGWVRKPPADLPMLAGYARIANPCEHSVEIVSASSGDFADVSLHATLVEDGISRMRAVDSLPVAAGETVELAPGGKHLMLMRPQRKLRDGDTVVISFRLADGGELRGTFEVKGPKALP